MATMVGSTKMEGGSDKDESTGENEDIYNNIVLLCPSLFRRNTYWSENTRFHDSPYETRKKRMAISIIMHMYSQNLRRFFRTCSA